VGPHQLKLQIFAPSFGEEIIVCQHLWSILAWHMFIVSQSMDIWGEQIIICIIFEQFFCAQPKPIILGSSE